MVVGSRQPCHHGADFRCVVVAKFVDDLVTSGHKKHWIDWAFGGVAEAFDVGSAKQLSEVVHVNSSKVEQKNDVRTANMRRYQKTEIDLFNIYRPRRNRMDGNFTNAKIRNACRTAGKIGYLGTAFSPFSVKTAYSITIKWLFSHSTDHLRSYVSK